MKKVKLNLSALKVKSFVTDLDVQSVITIKGRRGQAIDRSLVDGCPTQDMGSICPEPSQNGCTTQPTNNNESICVCN